jgi:hypothetical protein
VSGLFKSQRGSSRAIASTIKVVGLAVLIIGLLLVFAGCGGGSSLVGTWTNAAEGETMVFQDNGTMTLTSGSSGSVEMTYETKDGNLLLGIEGVTDKVTVGYSLDGDKLSLTSEGETRVYDRVK